MRRQGVISPRHEEADEKKNQLEAPLSQQPTNKALHPTAYSPVGADRV